MDNSKNKNIGFGNLVNDPEIILDDLTVFEARVLESSGAYDAFRFSERWHMLGGD